jgi:Flp pilus assembly pilin Flp
MASPFDVPWRPSLLAVPSDESGQDLAEYAILVGLIALVVVVAVATLGSVISSVFNEVGSIISGSGVGSAS